MQAYIIFSIIKSSLFEISILPPSGSFQSNISKLRILKIEYRGATKMITFILFTLQIRKKGTKGLNDLAKVLQLVSSRADS